MKPISTSIFDLYKIGPGPSSSHTIGPMRAGLHFLRAMSHLSPEILKKATKIEVHLYGSLSATGKGHGTDRAITAGLLGWEPETCDCEKLLKIFAKEDDHYMISVRGHSILFDIHSIYFDEIYHSFPFSNTMILRLKSKDEMLLEKEYYSLGGGFLQCKDEEEEKRPEPRYLYRSMKELKRILKVDQISLIDLILENEEILTGKNREEILLSLDRVLHIMEKAVERGLTTQGVLPGPLQLERQAPHLYRTVQSEFLHIPNKFLIYLDAYALAAAEENAAGHIVVTAPTSGSSGIIPAICYLLQQFHKTPREKLLEGLIVAAVIGFLAKHLASISGSEVGCQGEIGVASSMAAALVAYVDGCDIQVIENAAEIALEHQLGLTCDPIGGYVQIPCIERNAVAAVEAYNAFLLASSKDPKKHKISFDEVLRVMNETGRDMCSKYKETSKGGLATCHVFC